MISGQVGFDLVREAMECFCVAIILYNRSCSI